MSRYRTAGYACFAWIVFFAGAVRAEATNTPAIPKKWLSGVKGYEEALDLQKQTKAPMVVYFANYGEPGEKGLCGWWEKTGMQDGKVNKFLRDHIKVKIDLPVKKREQALFAAYRFNKTPAIFVVRADDGYPARCNVFNYENNRPRPKETDELIELFRKAGEPSGWNESTTDTTPSGESADAQEP